MNCHVYISRFIFFICRHKFFIDACTHILYNNSRWNLKKMKYICIKTTTKYDSFKGRTKLPLIIFQKGREAIGK